MGRLFLSVLYFIPPVSSPDPVLFSFCLLFYLPLLRLPHTHLPFFLLFVLAFCLKPTHLSPIAPQKPAPPYFSPPVFFYVLSLHLLHLSIYPSPPHSLALSPPLISLPMLWFVSPISVRAVITAVSSLGENKVVLCSWHHKRHKRNKRKEPKPKKKKCRKKEKLKRRE